VGWAKYYEDNVSICIDRMAMKESKPVYQIRKDNRQELNKNKAIEHLDSSCNRTVIRRKQQGRRGLELNFQRRPDPSALRKLQMNGWWWSKGNVCWCNSDTKSNRAYIESSMMTFGPLMSVVVYSE
jgi:hypothetical protein